MACTLATEFLCGSIERLRSTEDAVAAMLLVSIMIILISLTYKVVKEGPLVKGLWAFVIGLIPFLIWKFVGAVRRIFLENPPYILSYDFGEVWEALSALSILASFVYFYFLIKPRKTSAKS
jgi:hypothetical protein